MSVQGPIEIVTNGLVTCLDIGNSKSYPGTGTSINDLSTNDYTQTTANAAYTTIDGVNCLNCTTTGVTYRASTSFTLGTTWTMMTWARVITSTATWRTLWRTTPDDHPLLVETGSNRIGYYDNNAGGFLASGLDVSTLGLGAKWTLYTLVQTSTTNIDFYINGLIAKGSVSTSGTGNSHNAWGNEASGTQPFGHIALALIYNRNLSTSEILQNYNSTKSRFGL